MAEILKQDGTSEAVSPKNKRDFKLEELQKIVEGYIEVVDLQDGTILVINEEGKYNDDFSVNPGATRLFQNVYGMSDVIVGPALHCKGTEVR